MNIDMHHELNIDFHQRFVVVVVVVVFCLLFSLSLFIFSLFPFLSFTLSIALPHHKNTRHFSRSPFFLYVLLVIFGICHVRKLAACKYFPIISYLTCFYQSISILHNLHHTLKINVKHCFSLCSIHIISGSFFFILFIQNISSKTM